MSCRNLLKINAKKTENAHITYKKLAKYIAGCDFSILFEPKEYWDEILILLECNSYYLSITESKDVIECDDIFSIVDSFDYAIKFPKNQFEKREYEFLQSKLSFLNDIVKIIFEDDNVESIEFYVSDQYSTELCAFKHQITVVDKNITEALIKTYSPLKGKRYFGMKTVKFLINR